MARVPADLERRTPLARGGERLVHRDLDRRARGTVEAQQGQQLAVRVGDGDHRRLTLRVQLILDRGDGGLGIRVGQRWLVAHAMVISRPRPIG
jgi:hypothetical protein